MPAAAVIPAPIAYIKVVAVKKLVVGSRRAGGGSPFGATAPSRPVNVVPELTRGALDRVSRGAGRFTLKKLECSKQAVLAWIFRAWNNGIGRRFYFVGFRKST